MTPLARDALLARALRDPEAVRRHSLQQWDLLVRQARHAGLLARLQDRFQALDLLDTLPEPVRWHFEADATLARKQQIAVRWEVGQLQAALKSMRCPLVVLKGAAYVMADLAAGRGRLFNDIDILLPRARLGEAEADLMLAGWHATALTAYDDRYYRRWMHELPPLQHIHRATVLDVHHAILPETARYRPDPELLLGRIVSVQDVPGVYVLSAEDRILHSATHLFHDGDLSHGLRDLTDLDLLLGEAAAAPGFWPRLVARAEALQLGRSLFYALRYAQHFLDTSIPAEVWDALAPSAPNRALLRLMDGIFVRALAPEHASCSDALTPLARHAAYVRAHWLRMPPHLLVPHLFHKAFISPYQDNGATRAA